MQSGDIAKPQVDEEWITVPGGPTGSVRARVVKPAGATGTLPVIIYIHGAGRVFGNAHTHDRLVRELAVGANAAVVFPEYDLSPEARYPVAIEQNYTVARWVVTEGATKHLDATRIAVAGDSVGGNMSAALTLMAKERGDVPLVQQVLFHPVTDASFDTPSYHRFAAGEAHRSSTPSRRRRPWGTVSVTPRSGPPPGERMASHPSTTVRSGSAVRSITSSQDIVAGGRRRRHPPLLSPAGALRTPKCPLPFRELRTKDDARRCQAPSSGSPRKAKQ
ncbi:alpha/beta hydrolase [Streptosporangium pseudovulgare]|uniref:Alpha/beta hydrolase fold-3 domain-containing protein n=1 Tax=Streptosporangium pseudovulgare TaxID=35765 RepID=A0ABQ2R398_9ACTN|nr:hypothetical protein GCM10010140_47150 [Streptosporangium pseudovulgare]